MRHEEWMRRRRRSARGGLKPGLAWKVASCMAVNNGMSPRILVACLIQVVSKVCETTNRRVDDILYF